eukprot:gene17207-14822_t
MVILPVVGPTVDAIVATVVNTNIMSFLTLFLVISMSLSLGLHFTLCGQRPHTSVVMVFGDFDVHHFTQHTGLMGEALFITCLITANFILLNILIAVVGHEYEEQLKRCQTGWEERMIVEYERELRWDLAAPRGFRQKAPLRRRSAVWACHV